MAQVSVIIPTYNRAKWLLRAIDSVLNQSFNKLELIVIDDASTDQTEELISKLSDQRLKYIKLDKNSGVSTARNTGIKAAKHDWIAFLDSDDEWLPHKLEKQLEFASNNKDIKVIHSNEQWIRNGEKKNQPLKYKRHSGWIFDKCIELCCIGPSTSLVHKDVFNDVELFNEAFPVCEDYDFWLRASHKYEVGLVEEILINKYGGHGGQLSETHHELDYWRVKALEPFVFDEELFSGFSAEIQAQLKNIMLRKCRRLIEVYNSNQSSCKSDEIQGYLSKIKGL